MKPRRVFALGAFVGVAGWAACSTDYGETETTPADAGADVIPPDGAPAFEAGPPDADLDALVTGDAGSKVDAAGCDAAATCDCDKDGFDRPGCGNDAGKDCDDNDTRVRPDQGFLDIPGEPPRNGDWNCQLGIEKLYPTNIECVGLAKAGCDGRQGFREDPACGAKGEYVYCKISGLNCYEAIVTTKTQACR